MRHLHHRRYPHRISYLRSLLDYKCPNTNSPVFHAYLIQMQIHSCSTSVVNEFWNYWPMMHKLQNFPDRFTSWLRYSFSLSEKKMQTAVRIISLLFKSPNVSMCSAAIGLIHLENPQLHRWQLTNHGPFYILLLSWIHTELASSLTDTTGVSKHRLSPYNAYYNNNKLNTLRLPISARTKHAF